jgi:hypothetical protein
VVLAEAVLAEVVAPTGKVAAAVLAGSGGDK